MQDENTLPALVGQELFDAIPRGSALEAYLEWACQQHAAPPIYHLASALAVATHELARRGFRLGTGVPMGIWFALIGGSATGKTSSIRMADTFIHDVWRESGCTPTNDPWVEASGSIAGLLAAINEHYDPNRGTTVCMLYKQEFSSVFNTREAITEFLCDLADGNTIQRNLRELQKGPRTVATGGRPDRVYLPCTSGLFATTEPAISAVFTEAMRHGGLFSRVWWIRPKASKDDFKLRTLDYDAEREAALKSWCGWLAGATFHGTYTIQFSPEAWTYLEQFVYRPHAELITDNDDDNFNATRIRAVEKAQVISALYALMCGRCVIEPGDVQIALNLMRILVAHATLMQGLGSGDLMRAITRTEEHVRAAGNAGLTKREIYKRIHKEKRMVDLVIETLLDRGDVLEDKAVRTTRYVLAETARGQEIQAIRDRRGYEDPAGYPGLNANVIDLTRRRRDRDPKDDA